MKRLNFDRWVESTMMWGGINESVSSLEGSMKVHEANIRSLEFNKKCISTSSGEMYQSLIDKISNKEYISTSMDEMYQILIDKISKNEVSINDDRKKLLEYCGEVQKRIKSYTSIFTNNPRPLMRRLKPELDKMRESVHYIQSYLQKNSS